MSEKSSEKYSTIHYHSYLNLDKILGAQVLRSEEVGEEPAHEEMLFIITHQAYELWFKQVVHELNSVVEMFKNDNVDERSLGVANERMDRIIEILKLLVKQIGILETMTPLDFLDFRSYLFPASGFQSVQFRKIEVMLGLQEKKRVTYNNHHYAAAFPDKQREELDEIKKNGTLFDLVEDWLERTPFLDIGDFDFLELYQGAVDRMIEKEKEAIRQSEYLNEHETEMRLKMLGNTDTYFDAVFDEKAHQKNIEEGNLRLSYKATIAALLINLYRDEPILHNPFQFLMHLIDIDDLLTTWRYRHAQMVMRMLGKKIGTGGSSGHGYLSETASKHHIFADFHNISTLLIPRSELPKLPENLKKLLGFYFTQTR